MTGAKRYMHELRALTDLPPHIVAEPDPDNVRRIHVLLMYMPVDAATPLAAPYSRGVYWFTLAVPDNYPDRTFDLIVQTPSCRFNAGATVCISEGGHQNSSANRALSIAAFIVSLSVYMCDDTNAGAVGFHAFARDTPAAEKLRQREAAAHASMAYNLRQPAFRRMFPELVDDRAANERWLAEYKRRTAPARAAPAVEAPRKRVAIAAPAAAAVATDAVPLPDVARVPAAWFVQLEPPPPLRTPPVLDDLLLPELAQLDARLAAQKIARARVKARLRIDALDTAQAHLLAAVLRRNVPAFPGAAAPAEWPVPLFAHQQAAMPAILELDRRGGGILADPPGMGKTHMVAALLHATRVTGPAETLIVAAARLHAHWAAVLKKFGVAARIIGTVTWRKERYDLRGKRVVIDEAHLFNWSYPAGAYACWMITASPDRIKQYPFDEVVPTIRRTGDGVAVDYAARRAATRTGLFAHRMIRRLASDSLAALPAAADAVVEVGVPPAARALVDRLAHWVTRDFDTHIGTEFAALRRVEHVVAPIAAMLVTGHTGAAEDAVARLPSHGRHAVQTVRLRDNAPPPHAQVGTWLEIALRGGAPVCAMCHEDAADHVVFQRCYHVLCTACFDRLYAERGHPFCGLPCARTPIEQCYLLSVLRAAPPAPPAEPEAPAAGAKMACILDIVRAALARGERAAVVLPTDALVRAVHAAVLAAAPAARTIVRDTDGATIERLTAAVQAGEVPVVVMDARAVAVGLNLQHFHHVVLPVPALHPPDTAQLGGRFVRIGASVPSVTFYHLVARGTFERALCADVRAGMHTRRAAAQIRAVFAE